LRVLLSLDGNGFAFRFQSVALITNVGLVLPQFVLQPGKVTTSVGISFDELLAALRQRRMGLADSLILSRLLVSRLLGHTSQSLAIATSGDGDGDGDCETEDKCPAIH